MRMGINTARHDKFANGVDHSRSDARSQARADLCYGFPEDAYIGISYGVGVRDPAPAD